LQPRDQRGGFARRESRRIVDRNAVGEDDLVVLLEVVPRDVEEILVLVLRGLPRDAGHPDESHGVADLLRSHPEVFRDFGDADAIVIHEERHERQQEGQLVLRLQRLRLLCLCLFGPWFGGFTACHGQPPSS
jgi:hypothetical protein